MSASLPDGTLKPIKRPARDKMLIQMEQAYRGSHQYVLDKLYRQQALYRRRVTLAQNGLERTQRDIVSYLTMLAEARMSEQREKGKP